jgi:two-component system, OmpR family, response regulator MtrA
LSTTDDYRVLVVEDDASVREVVRLVLEQGGFEVTAVGDGRAAIDAMQQRHDLVVLDLMLPEMSGLDVCRELRRRSALPIVMLTARDETIDVVKGLEVGADDYVTKPFDSRELVARLRAVLRRTTDQRGLPAEPLRERDLQIDESAVRAFRGDVELGLSSIEFRLLAVLVRHAGDALSRGTLLQRVWGYDYLGDSRLIDMAVMRLREKLGEPPAPPPYISAVRGIGYRFERA